MDDPAIAGGAPASATVQARPEASAPQPPFSRPASRGWFAVLALLLVAGLLGGWMWLRNAQRDLSLEVGKRLADAEVAAAQARAQDSQMSNDLRETRAKLALLEARLEESQSQQASLEALYRELAPSRDEVALNEVEQVLLLASQQLAIAGNVQAALAALQLADAKLARMDQTQFVPLRRSLARDIDRLKAVPFVDVAGMSLKLDQALASIDALPLARDERLPVEMPPPAPIDEPAWRRALREAWDELRSLVRIEVADRAAAPLVPPPQQYFLRENLRLRLLAARVALLSHDVQGFKTDVTAANAWVKKYFDTRGKAGQTLTATLTQLAATPMPASVPDIATTITALRTLKATRDRAAAGAGR